MKKLVAVVCGAALMGGCGFMEPTSTQGSTSARSTAGTYSGTSASGSTMSTSASNMDFKRMDANSDGWVSREEYLQFYGMRYDTMKRNDRGVVSWQDMQTSDGRFFDPGTTSNVTGNPVTNRPGTAGGIGNPPATGGGSSK